MHHRLRLVAPAVAVMAVLAVLWPHAVTSQAQTTGPLLVFAASDLQFALKDVADAFEADGGQKPTFSFGSTGNLSQQIENGAPTDLFFAADEGFIDRLGEKGLLVDGTRQLYAIGRITVTPASTTSVQVTSLEDLARPELKVIAIANPEHAPYGLAAKQALESAGLWDAIAPKLVLGENISQTFQLIQTGNAEAGIVALSVVLGVPGTPYTLIDDKLHAPLRQAAAVIRASQQIEGSQAFLAFLNGPSGREIMKKYGFTLPGEM